ncbi:hypothetical protein CFOL_v3_21095 [Cephalotus follicularis]|uniref:Uncharacterized protein n=1 Tax=Cephalotus follicularis TaxID=3775 RepID=A0A1Q3CBL1_CEPFO|nr:hypothetical protein CFOL_v3_21095 [Cephalotus follicularis]
MLFLSHTFDFAYMSSCFYRSMAGKRVRGRHMDDLHEESNQKRHLPHARSHEEFQQTISTTPSGESYASDANTSTNKVRGPAKPLKQLGTDKRLILEWNEFHQPVGPNATLLAEQLRSFARNGDLLPLTVTSWSEMDQSMLDNIWDDILVKITLIMILSSQYFFIFDLLNCDV